MLSRLSSLSCASNHHHRDASSPLLASSSLASGSALCCCCSKPRFRPRRQQRRVGRRASELTCLGAYRLSLYPIGSVLSNHLGTTSCTAQRATTLLGATRLCATIASSCLSQDSRLRTGHPQPREPLKGRRLPPLVSGAAWLSDVLLTHGRLLVVGDFGLWRWSLQQLGDWLSTLMSVVNTVITAAACPQLSFSVAIAQCTINPTNCQRSVDANPSTSDTV